MGFTCHLISSEGGVTYRAVIKNKNYSYKAMEPIISYSKVKYHLVKYILL